MKGGGKFQRRLGERLIGKPLGLGFDVCRVERRRLGGGASPSAFAAVAASANFAAASAKVPIAACPSTDRRSTNLPVMSGILAAPAGERCSRLVYAPSKRIPNAKDNCAKQRLWQIFHVASGNV